MSEEFMLPQDTHADPLYRSMIELGFLTTTPVYSFSATIKMEDLKDALFKTNRMRAVPLPLKLADNFCPIVVTLARPIYQAPLSIEEDPDGEDIWPDWYIEGENLSNDQFGKNVRVYFLTSIRGYFWDGYIQTIEADLPSPTPED